MMYGFIGVTAVVTYVGIDKTKNYLINFCSYVATKCGILEEIPSDNPNKQTDTNSTPNKSINTNIKVNLHDKNSDNTLILNQKFLKTTVISFTLPFNITKIFSRMFFEKIIKPQFNIYFKMEKTIKKHFTLTNIKNALTSSPAFTYNVTNTILQKVKDILINSPAFTYDMINFTIKKVKNTLINSPTFIYNTLNFTYNTLKNILVFSFKKLPNFFHKRNLLNLKRKIIYSLFYTFDFLISNWEKVLLFLILIAELNNIIKTANAKKIKLKDLLKNQEQDLKSLDKFQKPSKFQKNEQTLDFTTIDKNMDIDKENTFSIKLEEQLFTCQITDKTTICIPKNTGSIFENGNMLNDKCIPPQTKTINTENFPKFQNSQNTCPNTIFNMLYPNAEANTNGNPSNIHQRPFFENQCPSQRTNDFFENDNNYSQQQTFDPIIMRLKEKYNVTNNSNSENESPKSYIRKKIAKEIVCKPIDKERLHDLKLLIEAGFDINEIVDEETKQTVIELASRPKCSCSEKDTKDCKTRVKDVKTLLSLSPKIDPKPLIENENYCGPILHNKKSSCSNKPKEDHCMNSDPELNAAIDLAKKINETLEKIKNHRTTILKNILNTKTLVIMERHDEFEHIKFLIQKNSHKLLLIELPINTNHISYLNANLNPSININENLMHDCLEAGMIRRRKFTLELVTTQNLTSHTFDNVKKPWAYSFPHDCKLKKGKRINRDIIIESKLIHKLRDKGMAYNYLEIMLNTPDNSTILIGNSHGQGIFEETTTFLQENPNKLPILFTTFETENIKMTKAQEQITEKFIDAVFVRNMLQPILPEDPCEKCDSIHENPKEMTFCVSKKGGSKKYSIKITPNKKCEKEITVNGELLSELYCETLSEHTKNDETEVYKKRENAKKFQDKYRENFLPLFSCHKRDTNCNQKQRDEENKKKIKHRFKKLKKKRENLL